MNIARTLNLWGLGLVVASGLMPNQLTAAEPAAPEGISLDPRVDWVDGLPVGPFVELSDGNLLTVDGSDVLTSEDGRQNWRRSALFAEPDKFTVRPERALLRTHDGTIILAFVNDNERSWAWDKDAGEPGPDVRLPTYVTRSLDDGKTWQPPQKLHDDWTGAIRDILQTDDGAIVFTTMKILRNPGRHGCMTYRSGDDGKTWQPSNLLDLGGHGHHDGALEPTIVQLNDGRLWMLIRTTLDSFYQTFSEDDGLTWGEMTPTDIDASTAPGMINRLESGRLMLVWNRLQLEGHDDQPRRGGDNIWSAVPASNQRKELSIAFSEDDGETWSSPVAIVRAEKRDTSYPYVFEHKPGELWITTMRGTVSVRLYENDFVGPDAEAYANKSLPTPPQVIREAPANESSILRLGDGSLRIFYTDMDKMQALTIASDDGGETWGNPKVEFETGRTHHGIWAFTDRDGQVHVLYLDKQGKGKVNVDYHINVLHRVSTDGLTGWSEPTTVFEGYTGALRGGLQLDSGRLLVPIGAWNHPDDEVAPNTGKNSVTLVYSDDNGKTWQRTDQRMTSPTYEDYNGSSYGAVEPSIVKLGNGRLWLLIRTQTGFMYESFSEDGMHWSEPRPSVFAASNSPAEMLRLDDGRVVVFWNNSEMPPRHDGDGVYGGRDAISAAISDDHGKTWSGFREVYRDPTRHDTPPKRGDRGTAYPVAAQAPDGHIVLVTGQGSHVRRILRIDPDWVSQTAASDDFADGTEGWHVFTEFGPAERWWRDREAGAKGVELQDATAGHALQLSRPEDRVGDGAVWNFPATTHGQLELRLRVHESYGGGSIALADRFFNPTDDNVPRTAGIHLNLKDLPGLEPGQWHTLVIAWDVQAGTCRLRLDDQPAGDVALRDVAGYGFCYLLLRNTSEMKDDAGWQIDAVTVGTSHQLSGD